MTTEAKTALREVIARGLAAADLAQDIWDELPADEAERHAWQGLGYVGLATKADYWEGADAALAALAAAGWAVVPVVATEPSFEEKTAINRAVELRWQRLLNEGKHGMYETLFAIVHEQRADAYRAMLAAARRG